MIFTFLFYLTTEISNSSLVFSLHEQAPLSMEFSKPEYWSG